MQFTNWLKVPQRDWGHHYSVSGGGFSLGSRTRDREQVLVRLPRKNNILAFDPLLFTIVHQNRLYIDTGRLF